MLPIDDVRGVLNAIQVKPSSIETIVSIMTSTSEALGSERPGAYPDGMFGHSPKAVTLNGHAAKANKRISDSIQDLAAALDGYAHALNGIKKDAIDTDDAVQTTFRRQLQQVVSCSSSPSDRDASCTLPGGTDGTDR